MEFGPEAQNVPDSFFTIMSFSIPYYFLLSPLINSSNLLIHLKFNTFIKKFYEYFLVWVHHVHFAKFDVFESKDLSSRAENEKDWWFLLHTFIIKSEVGRQIFSIWLNEVKSADYQVEFESNLRRTVSEWVLWRLKAEIGHLSQWRSRFSKG